MLKNVTLHLWGHGSVLLIKQTCCKAKTDLVAITGSSNSKNGLQCLESHNNVSRGSALQIDQISGCAIIAGGGTNWWLPVNWPPYTRIHQTLSTSWFWSTKWLRNTNSPVLDPKIFWSHLYSQFWSLRMSLWDPWNQHWVTERSISKASYVIVDIVEIQELSQISDQTFVSSSKAPLSWIILDH